MNKVDSDRKSKGVLWMLGSLVWHSTSTKVGVLIDVLLKNWKGDARQKLEHMKEFALGAVASVGKLHWKLWGEIHRNPGWWGVAMEWGHFK
jgi:hypothetical protein